MKEFITIIDLITILSSHDKTCKINKVAGIAVFTLYNVGDGYNQLHLEVGTLFVRHLW